MFEPFNLRDEAFPITPSAQDSTPWYGFSSLKDEFQVLLDRSTREPLRLCVLNRGKLGAGKTHAARYFTQQYDSPAATGLYAGSCSTVVESPKQGAKAFQDFTTRLFNGFTMKRIATAAENLRTLIGDENLSSELLRATGSEDAASAFASLTAENLLMFRAYVSGGGTSRELREIGVAKRLTSEHEFAATLVAAIYLLIHGQSNETRKLRRVFIWIDEMEDLVFFPTRHYLPFTQALREVIDRTDQHLTLMLNFTFAEPEDLPAIENILGQAIIQRINQHVVFQQPTLDDLREYLLDLLEQNRIKPSARSAYPFSDDSFDLMIETAASRTPRFLNKLCDAILRDLVRAAPKPEIPISRATIEGGIATALPLIEEPTS